MADVVLTINGHDYGGWLAVEHTRSMGAIAQSFRLDLTDRWPGQSSPFPVLGNESCQLRLGGKLVIDGYLDSADISVDESGRTISVAGRDKTGDLVDCSAVHTPDEWNNQTAGQLVKILAKPFGVRVTVDVDSGAPIALFKLQHGETAFEAIERICRLRALLPMADGEGGLLITRQKNARGGLLVEGGNILSASATLQYQDRFSQYLVRGQSYGTDESFGEAVAQPESKATDPGVTRYRPTLIIAEGNTTQEIADDRAVWEAAVRAGRSASARITVADWGDWDVNTLVEVRAPSLRLNGLMLVSEVNRRLDNSGQFTEISVVRPGAYTPEPPRKAQKEDMYGAL